MTDLPDRLAAALADRYRIEREVGRGGMATVYLAEDLKHHRQVAIKVLDPEVARAVGAERFVREVEVTAQLAHPHILPLFDSGQAVVPPLHDVERGTGGEAFLYYVMPYVEGETLRARLNREGQLPLDDALQITQEVADALAYAHSLGIVHRDIKPENILFAAGHAVVADFGIARALSAAGGEHLTETGMAIGTPLYMSPEQASGERDVDARSDVYALACVLYEMLGGEAPYTGPSLQAVIAKKLSDPVPRVSVLRETVPAGVEAAIMKALAKVPADRFTTVTQFADALARAITQAATPAPAKGGRMRQVWSAVRRNRWAAIVGGAATIAVILGAARVWEHQSRVRWARTVALPEASRLVDEGQTYAAFQLLRRAEAYVPDDPMLNGLLLESTTPVTVRTTPPNAQVHVRDFHDEPDAWYSLGSAPLDSVRLPRTTLVWRISLEGFRTMKVVRRINPATFSFSLQPADAAPIGMVHVPGGPSRPAFIISTRAVDLDGFWIDTYEVTNRRFKAFVDRGGYGQREYWTEPIVRSGDTLTWEESRRLFLDRTGQPGPATWEVGTYPDGQDEYPVGGISWYEAAAYCASVGKRLPTLYQWFHAADPGLVTEFIQSSVFAADGPAAVGHPRRLGVHGTYDMAGNVKEWVRNEASGGRRYTLGGGWSEPSYEFQGFDAPAPVDREPLYGVRCAQYEGPLPAAQTARVMPASVDWREVTPAGDEVFAVYQSLYEYDRIPLEPSVEPIPEEFEHWTVERVNFAAAYGNERVPAHLFLPKNARSPYQTVVYYPGAGPYLQQIPPDQAFGSGDVLFLVRSGRAVLLPVYKGMYDRYIGSIFLPHIWRDVMIHSGKDLRRAVDYLETRPDIDAERIAYFAISTGASAGPIMTAVEPRFAASVLLAGGLLPWRNPPESEAINFAPRVTVPTLMINGRYDFYWPYETAQRPLFQLLGTPPADKRHRVFESGHMPRDRQEVIRETLDWLDRYLGPVRRAPVSREEG